MQKRKSKMNPEWASKLEDKIKADMPEMSGKIDWDTAKYLWDVGYTAENAAQQLIQQAKRTKPV